MKKSNDSDNEIKLYGLLVDQILKYQVIMWQIPIALVIGNFLAIEKFIINPYALSCLALFNFGLIFVFYRMIITQAYIIEVTVKAEGKLHRKYSDFLPKFKKHKIRAQYMFVTILFLLEIILIVYVFCLFAKQFCRC